MNRSQWSTRALQLALGALLGVLACSPGDGPTRLFQESFEDVCDGMPCGWSRLDGDTGAARHVSTWHAGEHGIELEGEVAVAGPSGATRSALLQFGSLQARMAARCDPGAVLTVRVAVRTTDGTLVDTLSGRVSPDGDWHELTTVTVVAGTALLDGGLTGGPFGGGLEIEVLGITLRKSGPGVCTVDHLELDDGARFPGAAPDGC